MVMNIEESPVDSEGHLINTWADILNRADTRLEALHERTTHNYQEDETYSITTAHGILLLSTSSRQHVSPTGQGSFSDGMPLGISGTFNFILVSQTELSST